jgi:DNA mismatch repair ATPase MutL
MNELALHILDVAENSIAAAARLVEVTVVEDEQRDLLSIRIADDGRGMTTEELAKVTDPFYSTKDGHPVGLGVPLFGQAAREAGGSLSVESEPGRGTTVDVRFQHSHPDRMPLGALAETMAVLMCSHPDVNFVCTHTVNSETVYSVDTRGTGSDESSEGMV